MHWLVETWALGVPPVDRRGVGWYIFGKTGIFFEGKENVQSSWSASEHFEILNNRLHQQGLHLSNHQPSTSRGHDYFVSFVFKCHLLPLESTAQCQKYHTWNKADCGSKRTWQQEVWQEKCQLKFQLKVVCTAGDTISRFQRLTVTRSLPADELWRLFSVALLFKLEVAFGPMAALIHNGYRSLPRRCCACKLYFFGVYFLNYPFERFCLSLGFA